MRIPALLSVVLLALLCASCAEQRVGQESTAVDSLYSGWQERMRDAAADSSRQRIYQQGLASLQEAGAMAQAHHWQINRAMQLVAAGQRQEAGRLLRQVLSADSIGADSRMHAARNLGNIYYQQQLYDSALYYYIAAEQSAAQDAETVAGIHQSIASVHLDNDNPEEARRHFGLAMAYFATQPPDDSRAICQMNFARYHVSRQQYDSAMALLGEAGEWFATQGNQQRLSKVLNLQGNTRYAAGDYSAALLYYKDYAEAVLAGKGDSLLLAEAYNNIGACLFFLDQPAVASNYYQQAWALAQAKEDNKLSMHAAFNIAEVLELQGEEGPALRWYKRYYDLREQVYSQQKTRQIIAMQERYESDKKDQEIVLLEKDNALQSTRLSQKTRERNFTLLGLFIVLVAVCIIVYFYRQRQQAMQEVARQQDQLHEQEVSAMMRDQELRAMESLMQGRDQERNRLAAELHDRIGSLLATVSLHLSVVGEDPAKHLPQAQGILDEACTEVRELSHRMAGGLLEEFGLHAALEQLVTAVNATGAISISYWYTGHDQRLPAELEIALYRVIQELVSNILRHAEATEAGIQLNKTEEELSIMVEDNGKGMPADAARGDGIGWRNIRQRLDGLNAGIDIDSHPRSGTTVIIHLPLSRSKAKKQTTESQNID